MVLQTHNTTVMTANLTTLSEKGLKGGHRCEDVCVFICFYACVCVLSMWIVVQRACLGK